MPSETAENEIVRSERSAVCERTSPLSAGSGSDREVDAIPLNAREKDDTLFHATCSFCSSWQWLALIALPFNQVKCSVQLHSSSKRAASLMYINGLPFEYMS